MKVSELFRKKQQDSLEFEIEESCLKKRNTGREDESKKLLTRLSKKLESKKTNFGFNFTDVELQEESLEQPQDQELLGDKNVGANIPISKTEVTIPKSEENIDKNREDIIPTTSNPSKGFDVGQPKNRKKKSKKKRQTAKLGKLKYSAAVDCFFFLHSYSINLNFLFCSTHSFCFYLFLNLVWIN